MTTIILMMMMGNQIPKIIRPKNKHVSKITEQKQLENKFCLCFWQMIRRNLHCFMSQARLKNSLIVTALTLMIITTLTTK